MRPNRFLSSMMLLFFCVAFSQAGFSQVTFKDYFNESAPLTYLGVDFTVAKISGLTDFEIKDMKDRQFSGINQLVLNEPKKYDLMKFFHKSDVKTDISQVEEHNAKIDGDKIKSTGGPDDETSLTTAGVEKIVKGYNFGGKKEMGVMVIVESLSKAKEHGTAYLVFVDMSNNKVLYSEKFTAKGGGFGLRNYWAKVIFNVFDTAGDKYKSWKKSNGL